MDGEKRWVNKVVGEKLPECEAGRKCLWEGREDEGWQRVADRGQDSPSDAPEAPSGLSSEHR